MRRMENNIPTTTDSKISSGVKRNSGKIYMSAPVLIKKGGNNIFLTEAGFFAAFILINMANIAIKIAPTDVTIINTLSIHFIPFLFLILSLALYRKMHDFRNISDGKTLSILVKY